MEPQVYSLIVPVYKNEESIPSLIAAIRNMNVELGEQLEVVFVVDGSPDQSYAKLRDALPSAGFASKLLLLSRNFGSFSAIRCGLEAAKGPYFAIMAADLQEPPELVLEFFRSLANEPVDVVIGTRDGRQDPLPSRFAAQTFWYLYRKFVVPEMAVGGVDVFSCNQVFRDKLLELDESHSSLIALLFWLGFRRKQVSYTRLAREHGKSAWTFRKKVNYLMDSVFAFTDLPIKVLISMGSIGLGISILLGLATLFARIAGGISIPGYTTTIIIVLFFGTINLLGLGLVGSYAWRAYENTKRRPLAIVMQSLSYSADRKASIVN
jgi:glycosyltransferase involved in cell wall biosynthesis